MKEKRLLSLIAAFSLVFTGAAKMDTRSASAQTKVINLSSNIAALVTFIIAGNVYYPLGLAAAACSVAGNYLGSGLVVHDGQKIVRPVVLVYKNSDGELKGEMHYEVEKIHSDYYHRSS